MTQGYASRTGAEETLIAREDPVVYDSLIPDSHVLSAGQVHHYRERGYLLLPETFQDWVDPLLGALPRLQATLAGRAELVLEPDSGELRTIFAPHRFAEEFDGFIRDERLLNPVRQLLGSEVYIHQGRVNIKPPLNGRSFPWHSDFETWHVEDGMPKPRALSAWIMLTENRHDNGPLLVMPGSHLRYVSCAGETPGDHYKESLRKQSYGSPSRTALTALAEQGDIVSITGRPGTVVLHESNLMHGSADNLSVWPRTNAFFVFNSVENRLQTPQGGLPPRPSFLAEREQVEALVPTVIGRQSS